MQWPCFYGIDFATRAELIATGLGVEEIRASIGADSLGYISEEGMIAATNQPADQLCTACFTGRYPIELPEDGRIGKHVLETLPLTVRTGHDRSVDVDGRDGRRRPRRRQRPAAPLTPRLLGRGIGRPPVVADHLDRAWDPAQTEASPCATWSMKASSSSRRPMTSMRSTRSSCNVTALRRQVVVGDVETLPVLHAVDLDDEPGLGPPHIEVDPATRPLPDDLSLWVRKATTPAHSREVELAERLDPVGDVGKHELDEAPSPPATQLTGDLEELGRCRKPLLSGHEQDQGGLPVGDGPVRCAQSGDRRSGARDAGAHELIGNPPDHLVEPGTWRPFDLRRVHHGDMDRVIHEVLEPCRLQGGHAIEGRHLGAGLPDDAPQVRVGVEGPVVHGDRLQAVALPAAGGDLGAHVGVGEPQPLQQVARHDSVAVRRLGLRQLALP